MREKTSWREDFIAVFSQTGDKMEDLICTLTEEEWDRKFYPGYGSAEGTPFTAWSKDYVYFPGVYDGAEWVDYVARNPNGKPTQHIGGQ